jgi:hypothetical protein
LFNILFHLLFSFTSYALPTYPEAGWRTVRMEEKDLNGDHQNDQIYWLTMAKSLNASPERLLILVNQKPVLDYKSAFCEPSGQNGFANAEECTSLILETGPEKNMITLTDSENSSQVEAKKQTHSYLFNSGKFILVSASFSGSCTGQMQERDFELIKIDYINNRATRERWIEFGSDKKVKGKRSDKCELKKARKNEELQHYSGFAVSDEIKCKAK